MKKILNGNIKAINDYLFSLDISNADVFNMTFEQFLNNLEMNETEYLMALSFEIKKPTVF